MGTETTDVIFRVFPKREGGDVIALFPAMPWSGDGWDIASYQHAGQHGPADPSLVARTRLATPEEYADLKRELEAGPDGYQLRVCQRIGAHHRHAHRAECKRLARLG